METRPATQNELNADREKKGAALSSVVAAVFLTGIKIVVGVLTGSLGILAEAAHSGLDLMAAAVTFFAVRISGRPADRNHTYGHGKVENLSALFETMLLLVTCVWVIYEAVNRLFFKHVQVEVSVWSFVVMSISILVDVSRSRMLKRVAKKYDSQALEADALHFSTDIWSSAVVIIGLVFMVAARYLKLPFLEKADSIAALVVAGIVIYISIQLGRRAIGELLDEVPGSLTGQIASAANQPGVLEISQVRVRRSGPKYYVDLTASVSRSVTSEQAHAIAEQIEDSVQGLLPDSTVMVHIDPVEVEDEGIYQSLKTLAARFGFGTHHIRVHQANGQKILLLHLDIEKDTPLEQAHAQATLFEQAVSDTNPGYDLVVTHLEPVCRQGDPAARSSSYADLEVETILRELPNSMGIPCDIHDILLLSEMERLNISFHCSLHGGTSILDAHDLAERMETELRSRIPNLDQATIHMEPLPVEPMSPA